MYWYWQSAKTYVLCLCIHWVKAFCRVVYVQGLATNIALKHEFWRKQTSSYSFDIPAFTFSTYSAAGRGWNVGRTVHPSKHIKAITSSVPTYLIWQHIKWALKMNIVFRNRGVYPFHRVMLEKLEYVMQRLIVTFFKGQIFIYILVACFAYLVYIS